MATLRIRGIIASNAGSLLNSVSNFVLVGYATNFNRAGYNAYITYGDKITGLTKGVDYDGIWTIEPDKFPAAKLDWYIPEGPIPNFGVWGYGHISFLRSAGNSVQLSNITNLTTNFNWNYTGSTYFNLLGEVWLARSQATPVWSDTDALWEIGFFAHAHEYSFHNGGVLIGTTHTNGGVVYTCRKNNQFITFAPQNEADVLVSSFDWKAAFDFLVFHGVITGSEWLSGSGPLFGIEPTAKPVSGAGTHGGSFIINSLSTTTGANTTFANADYFGAGINGFADGNVMTGWDISGGFSNAGAMPDLNGGTSAVGLRELAQTSNHGFIKSGATFAVETRQMDYVLFEDFQAVGRTKFRHQIADAGFTNQIIDNYDATTIRSSNFNLIGSSLTRVGPGNQMISLGDGWYRTISTFRKAAGISQLFFTFLILDDAGTLSYAGDTSKGVNMRVRHRLIPMSKIILSGTPPAAVTGTAYSFIPTTAGGRNPITYSFVGTLPTGLSINSSTGEISGTPSATGTTNGIIRATGGDGIVGDLSISLSITSPPLTVWDTTTAASGVTFSENNRRITATGANLGARSTSSRAVSSGVQAEVEVISVNGGMNIGLGNASAILNGWFAQNGNGISLNSSNGTVSLNGSSIGDSGLGAITAGQRVAIILPTTGGVRFKKGTTLSPVYSVPTGPLYIVTQPNAGSVRIHTEESTSTVALESGVSRWN